MPKDSVGPGQEQSKPDWYQELKKYERPCLRKAVIQLLFTFIPYLGLWAAMVCLIQQGYSYLIVLPLTAASAVFLVSIFIFFHDCTHGSLLPHPGQTGFWDILQE
jgi:acyl-lipid omega-6 desaturase (Delta-12 desaturase)